MMKNLKSYCRLAFVLAVLCLSPITARAFVLIGPVNPSIASNGNLAAPNVAGTPAAPNPNLDDPMGRPTSAKEFYRWNYPELTYAFDSTFIRYFGHNGMAAVSNAFSVLNDFFEPTDLAYTDGVSSMNLITEFDQHFSTWEFNPSANINSVTDIESITLGMLVNHLGLGNPHRYCFVIHDVLSYNAAFGAPRLDAGTGTFQVTMRNYDPYTYRPTPVINGVAHSYWLYNDSPANTAAITIWDAVEYTVGSDHQYSAIAAIRDVVNFGGMPWPSTAPTVFRTPGVFFRPDYSDNKPVPGNVTGQVRDQPRHTLTFDDAGGLKYLYRTNNVVYEQLDASVRLVTAANMNPVKAAETGAIPPNSPFLTPRRRALSGLVAAGIAPVPPTGGVIRRDPTTIVGSVNTPAAATAPTWASQVALRGGINKIKFVYRGYDSLIGQDYLPHTTTWTDVFITNAVQNAAMVHGNPPYFSQVVQRTTRNPDIIFIANDLGVVGTTIPVISLPDTTNWQQLSLPNTQQGGVAFMQGPGTILRPGAALSIQYVFTTRAPFHQVVWTGQPGIEGNFVTQFQWGWVTNTGPEDYIIFPEADITQMEAVTAPSGTVASITHIDIINGVTGEDENAVTYAINRTRDIIHIYGTRTDTVTEIQVLDTSGVTVVQKINPRSYIISDQLIRIPPGVLSNLSEGDDRLIRLVNPKGGGPLRKLATINTGYPIVQSTQYDGLPLNVRKSLLIRGSGFLTGNGNRVDRIIFYDDNNRTNYEMSPPDGSGPPTQLMICEDSNASHLNGGSVNGDYAWTVTDNSIFIPADYFWKHNPTRFDNNANETAGGLSLLPNMFASDGNNTDVTVGTFARNIRLMRSGDSVIGPPRPNEHKFTHIGVGGEREDPLKPRQTTPIINEAFTVVGIPATFNIDDSNRTWQRGNNADVLTIRGAGLNLALSIEFVDGNGELIRSTDGLGLPPGPISLRNAVNPTVLAAGVTIAKWDDPSITGDRDGYEIQIEPVEFGVNGIEIWDSEAGTNLNKRRRVVIRTPFGTAIAPPLMYNFIQQ
jgi:hypothetical protein